MPNAARKSDLHTCPSIEPGPTPHEGGPIVSGCSTDVDIEFLPASRGSKEAQCDYGQCKAGGPDFIAEGAATVLINDMYATRAGDKTVHNGVIVGHAANVEIGGPKITFRKIKERNGGTTKPEQKDRKAKPTPEDKDKESAKKPMPDGTEELIRTSKGNCFAAFDIVSKRPLRRGMSFTLRCRSWDPDTGGSESAPNPSIMKERSWRVTGGAPYMSEAFSLKNGEESWSLELVGYQDFTESMAYQRVTIEVSVLDPQGHTSTATRSVPIWDFRKPEAVIKPVKEVFLSDPLNRSPYPDRTRFICESRGDRIADTGPTPLTIRERSWRCVGPTGPIQLEYDHGKGLNREVFINGKDLDSINSFNEPLKLFLRVQNDDGQYDETVRDVLLGYTRPVAKIGAPPKRVSWRVLGTAEEFVGGDRLKVSSTSYQEGMLQHAPNIGILTFEWSTYMGLSNERWFRGSKDHFEFELPDDMGVSEISIRLKVTNPAGASETQSTTGDNRNKGLEECDLTIEIVTWMEVFLRDAASLILNALIELTLFTLLWWVRWIRAGRIILNGEVVSIITSLLAQEAYVKIANRLGVSEKYARQIIDGASFMNTGKKFVNGVFINDEFLRGSYRALRAEGVRAIDARNMSIAQTQMLNLQNGLDLMSATVSKGIGDILDEAEKEFGKP